MASKRGICGQCGKERSLVAHGKCYTCNGYDKPKEKQGKFAPGVELPPPKITVKPEVMEARRKEIAERAERANTPLPPKPMDGKAHGIPEFKDMNPYAGPTVTFKTEVDNALFNKIAERARRNRREVGDEMLVLAEIALDYGNLGKDGGTITKVKEMIERMKSYPMPHGSSSAEVYQLTLQVIQARVEELAA